MQQETAGTLKKPLGIRKSLRNVGYNNDLARVNVQHFMQDFSEGHGAPAWIPFQAESCGVSGPKEVNGSHGNGALGLHVLDNIKTKNQKPDSGPPG